MQNHVAHETLTLMKLAMCFSFLTLVFACLLLVKNACTLELLSRECVTMSLFCVQLILNKVLLLGSTTQTIIGRPILPDAAVHAVVEEHVR